ncbi:hypothetical protein F4X73_07880 [Candidatus Poribacteria bacterium]|nr:hypothetical protein [Candidatus Poribacteria bacterium]MYB64597.1 hypothetical protein [Candidatus Poribacteria bacterium]
MRTQDDVEQQYYEAVDMLVERVKADPNMLAMIVAGSFSYAQVWEKSDLDVEIIGKDGIRPRESFFSLVENDVMIHASLTPRSLFKRAIESAQEGSFMHSYFSHSTLLFSRDDSIKEWYDKNASRDSIGERDKQLQLLNVIAGTLPTLIYAEKQFYVNRDIITCFLSLLSVVESLARIEVLLNNEIPAREVIQPALEYNPDFFGHVYTDLINCEKNDKVIQDALDAVNAYIDEREFIFQPILDYLEEQKGPRSNSELNAHFHTKFDDASVDVLCQWLAWKGVIQQVSTPIRLTVKSQITLEEPAYYYDKSETELRAPKLKSEVHPQIADALERFTDTIVADRYIVAAILTSNLKEENVWEKTKIDITLIMRDGTKYQQQAYQLIEDGIPISVRLVNRNGYKKLLERNLQGSHLHAIYAQSEILFTKDPTLRELHEGLDFIGERDRQSQLLNMAGGLTTILDKTEKWFYVKKDYNYTFYYLMIAVRQLARIEAIMNGEVPQRKAIYQALKLNPNFFKVVFTDVLDNPKDELVLEKVLDYIDIYLEDHIQTFFSPILDFLEDAGGERSLSDIYDHFGSRQLWLSMACEWLSRKDVLELFSSPIRLTMDSKVSVDEPAYFYDIDNPFL